MTKTEDHLMKPAEPKRMGRPPLPPEQRKAERIELRTTQARLTKLCRLAETAGVSVNAHIEQWIDSCS